LARLRLGSVAQAAGCRIESDLPGQEHRLANADRLRIGADGRRRGVGVDCLSAHDTLLAPIYHAPTSPRSVFDFVARLDPGVDAPAQRPDALEADLPQLLRHSHGGGLRSE